MIEYEVYTDGAYSSSRNKGGIGIAFIRDGKVTTTYNKGFEGMASNNRAELLAVIAALLSFKEPIDKLTIYSDSMYVVGHTNMGWKRNNNFDLWARLDKAMLECKAKEVIFKHVKGHEDNKYNNIVDKLAVNATK